MTDVNICKRITHLQFCFTCFLLFAIFFTCGCSRNNDILVSLDNDKITRGEFRQWLEANNFSRKEATYSKMFQEEKLAEMAVDRIVMDIAKKNHFTTQPDIQFMSRMIEENIVSRAFLDEKVLPSSELKTRIVRIRQIYIPSLKGDETILKDIISDLGKSRAFDELAARFSRDEFRKLGGDAGYYSRETISPDLADAVFSLDEGAYTKKPISTPRGVFIIMVTERKDADYDDMSSLKGNGIEYIRQTTRLRIINGFISSLAKRKGVMFNETAAANGTGDETVFKIDETVMTARDYTQFFNKTFPDSSSLNDLLPVRRIKAARDLFNLKLIFNAAQQNHFSTDSKTKESIDTAVIRMIVSEWMKTELSKTMEPVSDTDIAQEFNKKFKSGPQSKSTKSTATITPLIKNRISDAIQNRRMGIKRAALSETLKNKYHVIVHKERIEGK